MIKRIRRLWYDLFDGEFFESVVGVVGAILSAVFPDDDGWFS